jgi:hypothetical protein
MARQHTIQHIRTTRTALNDTATAEGLKQGEIYLITDEDRLAVGLSTTTYETYAKEDEVVPFVTLTQAEYEALTPDADTLYFIIPA